MCETLDLLKGKWSPSARLLKDRINPHLIELGMGSVLVLGGAHVARYEVNQALVKQAEIINLADSKSYYP